MKLTKTDFIHFINCPKSFWLAKHEPDNYPSGEFSIFTQKLVREGYEVEKYVRDYFDAKPEHNIEYQRVFQTDDGLFARVDGFEVTEDGSHILYEVKSSTSIKKDKSHNHIKDACFQKICAERSGTKIHKVFLIHLNGDYVREGDVDAAQLLKLNDITIDIAEMEKETEAEIDMALSQLKCTTIDKNGCSCLFKTRSNHCDTFSIFNPEIPQKLSIYSLPRISKKKITDLVNEGLLGLQDVSPEYKLSDKQKMVLVSAQSSEPQINHKGIKSILDEYHSPLHFFDFETYASAVPMVYGASPHKHFPVQYSLHTLHEDGNIEHREFLQKYPILPLALIEQMEKDIGANGSIISWHASFEKTQNREMAKWFPEKLEFLTDINNRMLDLEDIFKEYYVDARFDGSTSIKKVLPIICPHLNYDSLNVQNGSSAMEAWQKMINAEPATADNIANELLKYCKLDTFAMVEIYRFLKSICQGISSDGELDRNYPVVHNKKYQGE